MCAAPRPSRGLVLRQSWAYFPTLEPSKLRLGCFCFYGKPCFMCRWAPPYFPGLESMAARKNGVYLADEDGGESGSECSARPLWRSSLESGWSAAAFKGPRTLQRRQSLQSRPHHSRTLKRRQLQRQLCTLGEIFVIFILSFHFRMSRPSLKQIKMRCSFVSPLVGKFQILISNINAPQRSTRLNGEPLFCSS